MRRIILSLITVIGAGAIIISGATGAFFSDTETSTGNTFAAGAIDLKIDNDSYYNGNRCVDVNTDENIEDWQWQGTAVFPEAGSPCNTSFPLSDLGNGLVFFDFNDLKPDDEGEDTISIHVQNDAWACMDLTLTSNDDVSSNEPELEVDVQDTPDMWDGELAQNLQFFWWADDGDNVFEIGEQDLSGGVKTLYQLAPQQNSFSIVLADSQNNAWATEPDNGIPLPANDTVYIAKAWCMGTLTLGALGQDSVGTDGPQIPGRVGGGFSCDGTLLDNKTQTDMVQMTLMFRAEQARHNPDFLCNPPEDGTAKLTVNKALLVSTGSIEINDFTLHIVGPNGDQVVTDEVPVAGLPSGSYTVYEQVTGNVAGKTFITTFSGVCSNVGNSMTSQPFNLNASDNVTCTILNDEVGDNAPPTFN